MSDFINQLLGRVAAGEDLARGEMSEAIGQVMTGQWTEEQIGLLLTSLAAKGETVAEVAGAASAMRANMTPIRSRHDKLLDTCGTGGGGSTTFNISTSAALVIAAVGVPLAKHGNRSVTSKSGSADVLAELGVNIQADVAQVERCLDELGICFCFAPLMHPAMKHVAAVRKKLGIRTIFNLLGPLANPAGATYQLLGVGFARAASVDRLGDRHVGHRARDRRQRRRRAGRSLARWADRRYASRCSTGESQFQWQPSDFGLEASSLESIQVTNPSESADIVRQVLAGEPGAARDIVLLNAAAGLLAAGHCTSPAEGTAQAARSHRQRRSRQAPRATRPTLARGVDVSGQLSVVSISPSAFSPSPSPLPRPAQNRDISGQLVFLGTGTSVGVPAIGCNCPVCLSDNPRNKRTRCGLAIGLPDGNLLIDTPPDLRTQLLRENLGLVHAVVYTHEHADHIFGLDDLRLMQFYLGGPVPLYCEPQVEARIRKSFDYAFRSREGLHAGAVPQLAPHTIGLEPFQVLGAQVVPVRLQHGPFFKVLGFRFGNVAYCTDTNSIPAESRERLQGLDVLILDCLRRDPHTTHFGLDEALAVAADLAPKRTLLTHISHDLDHDEVSAELPPGVEMAYDGLSIALS